MSRPSIELPARSGPKPHTTQWAPHLQIDQNAPQAMLKALADRVFALAEIEERPTLFSADGARALWLKNEIAPGPSNAFLGAREIGHFHPWDGSMHVALPPLIAPQAVSKGWAEIHPVALAGGAALNIVMVFGPRTPEEVDIIFSLLQACCRYAAKVEDA